MNCITLFCHAYWGFWWSLKYIYISLFSFLWLIFYMLLYIIIKTTYVFNKWRFSCNFLRFFFFSIYLLVDFNVTISCINSLHDKFLIYLFFYGEKLLFFFCLLKYDMYVRISTTPSPFREKCGCKAEA